MEIMKLMIIEVLSETLANLERTATLVKKTQTKSMSIMDVKPIDLPKFMKDNNIPDNAYFDGNPNGYDGWDDILISWTIEVPTTEKDKLDYIKQRLDSSAFRQLFHTLTANGYKRVGFDTGKLKEFKDTTVYDMLINKDFDRLVKYYSLYFVKNGN